MYLLLFYLLPVDSPLDYKFHEGRDFQPLCIT